MRLKLLAFVKRSSGKGFFFFFCAYKIREIYRHYYERKKNNNY